MRSSKWIQFAVRNPPRPIRLFCFPHAGGGASAFHSWEANLPETVQVCAVQLPGRETRLSEPRYTEFNDVLSVIQAELQAWLDLPYAVFGHSMGALLAFDWVRRIQSSGGRQPEFVYLSGRSAPESSLDTDMLHQLPDDEFIEKLSTRYQGIPREVIEEPELRSVFLPTLRADVSIVESYRFHPGPPLDCPLTVCAGVEDATVAYSDLVRWKRQTTGPFAASLHPGGHFYPQGKLLKDIAAALQDLR